MVNSNKKSSRKTGGLDGKYIVPLFVVAALVMLAALTVSTDGDGNLSETKEYHCGQGSSDVIATLDTYTGKMTISGTGKMADYSNDNKAPWESDKDNIWSVVIETGVEHIGAYAFNECYMLGTVTISDSVTSIGSSTFNECLSLRTIDFGKNITNIDSNTFPNHVFYDVGGVIKMESSELAGNKFNKVDVVEEKIKMVKQDSEIIDGVKYTFTVIGTSDSAFIVGIDGFNKSEFAVPATVTHGGKEYTVIGIDVNAFKNCTVLEKLTIPNTVLATGLNAFIGCTNLKEITIAAGSITIFNGTFPEHAFFTKDGTPLTMLQLPGNTFRADGKTAEGKIKMVKQDSETVDGVKYIFNGDSAVISGIDGFSKSEFTVPATVTHGGKEYAVIGIGEKAFENCTALEKLTIPDTVQTIGANAFNGCTKLATIIIGKNVAATGINPDAFPSHVFYDGSTKITSMSQLPGNTFRANGEIEGKIKMVREGPSPTPTPAPTPTPTPTPTPIPDKQTDDLTAVFLVVVFATVIALIGLALIIARRK